MHQDVKTMIEPDTIERYDRQIRLWGQHGQNKFSSSKVCLINANSLGTEILRGLCLAGIGSFTILDSHKLTPEDVGCNFVWHSSVGKNRGDSVRNMLLDLNEEVCGEVHPLEAHLPHIVQNKPDHELPVDSDNDLGFWKQFNCVIASGFLYLDQVTRLSRICWMINVPLIVCKSIGFFGTMRSQFREHIIVETHPDNILPEFNLDRPFEDLKNYFDSIDLEDDSVPNRISSFPYIVIVYKYLRVWQDKNGFDHDRLPRSYSEKRELRQLIDQGLVSVNRKKRAQSDRNGHPQNKHEILFENYIEASKSINSCLNDSTLLNASVESIFNHPKVRECSAQNVSRFWLIVKAVREFVISRNDGRLPVSGSIPDMISSSEEYLKLQSIYAKKAREDIDSIFSIVQTLIDSSSCSPGSSLYDETKLICRNIRDLSVIHSSPIFKEYDFKSYAMRAHEDEDDEFITISLCLRAMDLFFSVYGRIPGCQDDQVETDISKLKECTKQMTGRMSSRLKTLDQCLYELCRCGGAELHVTSAFVGGCIAQEVIKLITNQYVPLNDTLVYNSMSAATRTFKFTDTFERT